TELNTEALFSEKKVFNLNEQKVFKTT
ncbi:hypothetical protein J2X83_006043, partial [Brevibacillus nitrificans]|nr:hypothetical protein [Brevibacillus nitrificans]